jgi:methanogenic corrinoid protein MtbC1
MENLYKLTATKIKELIPSLPKVLIERHFEIQPYLKEKYKERHIQLYLEDSKYHLIYLSESISVNEPKLFNEYLEWAKTFFANLSVTEDEIILNLEIMRDELTNLLTNEMSVLVYKFISDGIDSYKKQPEQPTSFILDSNPLKQLVTDYLQALIHGNKKLAHDLIMNSFTNGTSIKDLYLNVFQTSQKEVGMLWQTSKINVAQEHYITAATQLIMSQLYPFLFTPEKKDKRIIVSCINGELHELAPRMLADLFELDGWDTYYFGANTPLTSLIKALENYKPNILAISTTMVFNLGNVSELIRNIKATSFSEKTKILVGGYPFNITSNLWKELGADGTAIDALSAIRLANDFIN